MENNVSSVRPDALLVAACGLYCGACRKHLQGKCPGCKDNVKATWCKIRSCCMEYGYKSCADCTLKPLQDCKTYNNFIGKVFGFIFRSDRAACIRRIKIVGYEAFAKEMQESNRQTIRK